MTEKKNVKKKCCKKYRKNNKYCQKCPIPVKIECIEKTKKKKKKEEKKKKEQVKKKLKKKLEKKKIKKEKKSKKK